MSTDALHDLANPGWWFRHGRVVLLSATVAALVANIRLVDFLVQRYPGDAMGAISLVFLVWMEAGFLLFIQVVVVISGIKVGATVKIASTVLLLPQILVVALNGLSVVLAGSLTEEWYFVHLWPTLVLVGLEAWLVFGRFATSKRPFSGLAPH